MGLLGKGAFYYSWPSGSSGEDSLKNFWEGILAFLKEATVIIWWSVTSVKGVMGKLLASWRLSDIESNWDEVS